MDLAKGLANAPYIGPEARIHVAHKQGRTQIAGNSLARTLLRRSLQARGRIGDAAGQEDEAHFCDSLNCTGPPPARLRHFKPLDWALRLSLSISAVINTPPHSGMRPH